MRINSVFCELIFAHPCDQVKILCQGSLCCATKVAQSLLRLPVMNVAQSHLPQNLYY